MGRTLSAREVVFGFGAQSDIDDADELLRMAQQADRGGLDISRCRTTRTSAGAWTRTPPSRSSSDVRNTSRVSRTSPTSDPARSHAGTNGDDFPRLGLTSARKRGEAGWSVIGSSGLRVAAECAGCPLG